MKVKRALISVYKKEGIDTFAKLLTDFGVEILSSGGTAKFLLDKGIPVIQISEITGFPEILDGRIKTIHPKISAGILALKDKTEHMQQLEEHQIKPIDLVVVNLYPFLDALSDDNKNHTDMLELIDIGGPTLIRAAAKNYPHVAVITSTEQLSLVTEELNKSKGEISDSLKQKLAQKAFLHTAYYDAMIANYFSDSMPQDDLMSTQFVLPFHRTLAMRYGENPNQKAGFFQSSLSSKIEGIEQLQGIDLSYNNLLDVDSALNTVQSFDDSTVVIMKHTNPCGIGTDEDLTQAYQKAFDTDPISAFGGILIVNRKLSLDFAEKLKSHFLEVLLAPEFSLEALEFLKKKKKLRILKYFHKTKKRHNLLLRSALNGYLVQEADLAIWDENILKVVTDREPTSDEWQALEFNWKVVKHVKSNAIVFGTNDRTLGIGAGQMSRVDSVELAVQKAKKIGISLVGSVLASDAFFPFRDGVDVAVKAGTTAIIQPGGSIRDNEVIAAANEHKIAMVFTRIRHFRH